MQSLATTRTTVDKKSNKKGTVFALVTNGAGKFEVWKLCENYNGRLYGGIEKTWRYVEKNMTEDEARALFNRRIEGTQR